MKRRLKNKQENGRSNEWTRRIGALKANGFPVEVLTNRIFNEIVFVLQISRKKIRISNPDWLTGLAIGLATGSATRIDLGPCADHRDRY